MNFRQIHDLALSSGQSQENHFLPAVVGAALVGGAASVATSKMANKASAKEAGKSRDFTEEQMKHQHQWEVDDLKKAGLNPILSAHGSNTGASAMASQAAPQVPDLASSAVQAMRLKAEIDNIKADTLKKTAETTSISHATVPKREQARLIDKAVGVVESGGYAAKSTAKAFTKNPVGVFNVIKNGLTKHWMDRIPNSAKQFNHGGQ